MGRLVRPQIPSSHRSRKSSVRAVIPVRPGVDAGAEPFGEGFPPPVEDDPQAVRKMRKNASEITAAAKRKKPPISRYKRMTKGRQDGRSIKAAAVAGIEPT